MPILHNLKAVAFCVPSALAALTDGNFTNAEELLIKHFGPQGYNRSLYYPIILKVLKEEGYIVERMTGGFRPLGVFLLCFKGHVAVVENGTYIDNQHPEGIRITKMSRIAALEAVYHVMRPERKVS